MHILHPPPLKENKSNKLNKRKKKRTTTTSSINFTGIHSAYFSLDRPEVLRNDKTPQRISTLHNPPVNYFRSQLLNLRTKYSIPDDLFYFLKDSQILRTRGIRAGLSLRYEHRQISALRCRNEVIKSKHNAWKGVNLNNLCYVRQREQFPLRPTQPGFRGRIHGGERGAGSRREKRVRKKRNRGKLLDNA